MIIIGNRDWHKSIIEVPCPAQMVEDARVDAEKLGELRNSITKGQSNIFGKLGERIAHDVLQGDYADTYDYDIVLPSGVRVDVKSKRVKGQPFPYFSCNVASYNTRQDCDAYVFVRVSDNLSRGWVLGWYPKKKFYEDAEFRAKGTADESNGHVEHCDSYRLLASQLFNVDDLPSWERV